MIFFLVWFGFFGEEDDDNVEEDLDDSFSTYLLA